MSVTVKAPGLATSVQDLGRFGYYHLGIPQSGAMDRYSLRVANMLVGNEEGAAALEAVFMGPELEFSDDRIVAVTGAEMPPRINGKEMPAWEAFQVTAGDTLSFDFLKSGARIYIAISGGIDVPEVLGSRSTYALGVLGGKDGRPVQGEDVLALGDAGTTARDRLSVPEDYRRVIAGPTTLRMIPDIYWHRLTDSAKAQFLADEWKVAPEADRIGYRFKGGQRLEFVEREQPFGAGSDPSNIVDSCYPYGSIQVPSGTEPIVLHRDAVSGGGYFMVGTVISADMDIIGQLQPHMPVHFQKVSMDEALSARKQRQNILQDLRDLLT
ncbi:biotin-dependent carboxyltransferase family protein [Emcibacter nanhaiensis]|uniref:Biotin-dependent carboxyltransferase n=1 Tax=Emcibacter nanhaiensis TaxID=1505037 RepID=A0A501PJV6_9PROT|nr:biotin-dependent carboxyltransferase family protein [Emcibacter nanhaiensis]TPD60397.1 biotin-dependent carboxyltransferase [Emcibacter nanhaiensis]